MNQKKIAIFFASTLFISALALKAQILIDHDCTDTSKIPSQWIDSAKSKVKMYYGHTSHGRQLLTGFDSIEAKNNRFNVTYQNAGLPTVSNSLCILDGKPGAGASIYAKDYWETDSGMAKTRKILTDNPSINFSMFMWCDELGKDDTNYVKRYLDSMQVLEKEFANVKFIYTTSNVQNYAQHHSFKALSVGLRVYQKNQKIREFCKNNKKILYDFGDIDAWYNGEMATTTAYNVTFPREHSQYNIDQAGHTSFENCFNKGKAAWWMFAMLAGWSPDQKTTIKTRKSPISIPELPVKKKLVTTDLLGKERSENEVLAPGIYLNTQTENRLILEKGKK